jgi:hypothetical protein
MSVIRTNAAAAMLGVSPNTLRSWERRFGYPTPRRTEGGHRQFDLAEIEALRQAFEETHNISSAISVARERGQGLASPARLRAALAAYDDTKADRLLEESLAVRSVERTVETLLIAAVEALDEPGDGISPEYGFAWRYCTGWLAAVQRVAPPASLDQAVLIFDATRPTDIDALYVQALELFLRRAGMRTLSLPVELEPTRVARALCALEPDAVVLSGGRATLDALGRLVYVTRQSRGDIEVFDYRGALPETGASTVERLGPAPMAAAATLRERLTAGSITPLSRRSRHAG